MNKKLWIGLGAAITAVSPIVTVVACGKGPGSGLSEEVQTKNLNKAVSDVKAFEMSTKTIAEIKADELTEGKVLKESYVTSNGITLPKLPKGITRRMTVNWGLSKLTNTFGINIELSSKINKKDVTIVFMAKDGEVEPVNALVDLLGLSATDGGLIGLPESSNDKNPLSIKRIIADIANLQGEHLGKQLMTLLKQDESGMVSVIEFLSKNKWISDIIKSDWLSKLVKTGLKSFDNNDLNSLKKSISAIIGNYGGDNSLIKMLLNGITNETYTSEGSPEKLTDALIKMMESIPGLGSFVSFVKDLIYKITGTWNNFLTIKLPNGDPHTMTVDQLQYADSTSAGVDNFFKSKFDVAFTPYLLPLQNEKFKDLLRNHKSLKDPKRNILTSIEYMKTLDFFDGFKDADFALLNITKDQPILTLTKDKYVKTLSLLIKIGQYFDKNEKSIKEDSYKSGEKVVNLSDALVTDEAVEYNDPSDGKIKSSDYIFIFKYITNALTVGGTIKIPTIDQVKKDEIIKKYFPAVKAAITRNQNLINGKLSKIALLNGKGILSETNSDEFTKTVVQVQSMILRALVAISYKGYGFADNLMFQSLTSGMKQITDILSNEAVWKIATMDITAGISEDMFTDTDFDGISKLLKLFLPEDSQFIISGPNLKTIFMGLLNGISSKTGEETDLSAAINKIFDILLNGQSLPDIIKPLIAKILFGKSA